MPAASNEPEWADPAVRPCPLVRRRVVVVPDGPVLVEGPVAIQRADGSTIVSDRFMVAVCVCRRSRRFPLCDTSHRLRRGR